MHKLEEIADRIKVIRNELGETNLVAVTKYSPIEVAVMAYQERQFDLGENKVSDLKTRANYFSEHNLSNVRWHFIGHLQTNKVKDLMCIPNLYAIHSVDSLRLVQELVKYKDSFKGIELNIFLQVNTSHETEKGGFNSMEELEEAVQLVLHTDTPFKMKGLMTMGTLRTENFEIEARRCFQELIKIKKTLQEKYTLVDLKLSMGMSQDYKIAHELGADYVRLGSSLFT
jgi:pyridoxal phosphate enzyme (YggS family)